MTIHSVTKNWRFLLRYSVIVPVLLSIIAVFAACTINRDALIRWQAIQVDERQKATDIVAASLSRKATSIDIPANPSIHQEPSGGIDVSKSRNLSLAAKDIQMDMDVLRVVILIVGYDRAICDYYGKNCYDSKLSLAFNATGDTLIDSLAGQTVYRIDVKQLDRKWLNTDMRVQETYSQALLRTLSEVSTAIMTNQARVSALIYIGHGFRAGHVGPTFEGESVNLIEAAQYAKLADYGTIVAVACSVALHMDLSEISTRNYHVFAVEEYIDWLNNGYVKLASQPGDAYKPANSLSLPEQTRYEVHNDAGTLGWNQTSPTIQEVVLQALGRTAK